MWAEMWHGLTDMFKRWLSREWGRKQNEGDHLGACFNNSGELAQSQGGRNEGVEKYSDSGYILFNFLFWANYLAQQKFAKVDWEHQYTPHSTSPNG